MRRALEQISHSKSVDRTVEPDASYSNSTRLSSFRRASDTQGPCTPSLSGADNVSSFCNSSSGDEHQAAASGSGDTWPAGPCMASNSDLHKYNSLNLAVDAIQLTSRDGADAAVFLPEDLAGSPGIAADLDGDDHGAFGAALFAGPFAMLAVAENPDDFYDHIADAPLDLAPWPSAAAQHPSATVPAAAASAAASATAAAVAAAALHIRWQELQQQYHVHLCAPDDIDASTPLGEGGYATVYAGRYKGREVAVKVVKVPAPQLGQQVDQEALQLDAELALVKELEAHLHAQRHAHPHIIRVVAYCREALAAILLERCDTTLEARVKALRGQAQLQPKQHHQQPEQQQHECQWQVWLGVLTQLASAVCHLHSKGCLLLHNDLKTANVLLQGVSVGADSTSWQLKVADFGLACKAEAAHSVAGLQVPVPISHNSLWLTPELMMEGGVATLAADIYSLGCVMYEVLTGGRTPRVADHDRPDVVSLRVRIQAEERKLCPLEFPPDDMRMPCLRSSPPTDIENLFKACSSVDRAARPTAYDVLARLQHQCVC